MLYIMLAELQQQLRTICCFSNSDRNVFEKRAVFAL